MTNPNLAMRRTLKQNAPAVAKLWAEQCLPITSGGVLSKIDHPAAVGVLRRAFQHLLQNGLEPHTVKLTPDQAHAFPGIEASPIPGATPYLAVGVDRDGRGTYAINWITTPGAPELIAEQANRAAAVERLTPYLSASGFEAFRQQTRQS